MARARCQGTDRQVVHLSAVPQGQLRKLCGVAVSRQEHHAANVLFLQAVQNLLPLCRELRHILIHGCIVQDLTPNTHKFVRGPRLSKCLDQPIDLLLSQNLRFIGFIVVVDPVGSVVKQEKLHVHKPEGRGHTARRLRQAVTRIAPKSLESIPRPIGMNPTTIAVVWAKIVVVPDGVVGARFEQVGHLLGLSRVRVTVQKSAVRLEVHFSQIDIVAKPQHHIWVVRRHALKDLVPSSIRLAGAVVFGLVDVRAAPGHKRKRWRIHAVVPEHLGRDGNGFTRFRSSHQKRHFVRCARLEVCHAQMGSKRAL